MTIRRNYKAGKAILCCNGCFSQDRQEVFSLRTDFADIVTAAKRDGWSVKHFVGGLFFHYCPACTLINRTSASYQERIHA